MNLPDTGYQPDSEFMIWPDPDTGYPIPDSDIWIWLCKKTELLNTLNLSRTRLRGWSWVFLSSTAFLPPSVMNSTGCQLGNASSSRSLSSCDIASLVRRSSIWRNSVVRWVRPLVSRVCALPHVVISLFRDSDFEDLATGLLLSLGPTCGTLSRPKSDNHATIYYKSKLKTFLFQQSWALLWIHI